MTDSTTTFDTVVSAARAVVDGRMQAVEIGIRDGVVAAIEAAGTSLIGRTHLTLAGDEVLIPGLVDTHVHINEPGRTEWEGFETATRAAAAGGITTVVDMPLNSIPATTSREAPSMRAVATTLMMPTMHPIICEASIGNICFLICDSCR